MASASGASWSNLNVPVDANIYVAKSDLKEYFYHLGLPDELCEYFALPPVDIGVFATWDVPDARILGPRPGMRDHQIFPVLCVVPMGWSWAMWFANRTHAHQALLGSGLGLDRLITDQAPAPCLEVRRARDATVLRQLECGGHG